MAEVYEAVAMFGGGIERRVAIKRILAHLDDDNLTSMFLDEARIVSQLHHANIVAIIDFGIAEGRPFQVLDFVDGADAAALMRRGGMHEVPTPIEACLHIVREVAQGLEAVHGARSSSGVPLGIVHRDVSPKNILISWQGDVKLADFGIAFANARLERTSTGMIKGTHVYMAPEQTLGSRVGPETDIFALGCTLHALIVGRTPLSEPDNVIRLLRGESAVLDSELPADVALIVGRCLQPSMAKRFASARELALAISAAISARGVLDGRALLVRWLEGIRDKGGTDRPTKIGGALDAMLLPDLVFDAESNGATMGEALRVFAVERTKTTRTYVDDVLPAQPKAHVRHQERLAKRQGRSPWLVVVPLMVVLGAIGAVAIRPRSSKEPHEPSPVASASATPVTLDTAASVDVPAGTTAAPVGSQSRPAVPPSRSAAVRRNASAASVSPTVELSAPTKAAGGLGVVRIGGEGALRAEIVIDGASRGYAPKELLLPIGHHTIILVAPTGTTVARREVDLGPLNTPSSPVVWHVGN